MILDPRGDESAFTVRIRGLEVKDSVATVVFRPKFLFFLVDIVIDDRVRRIKNRLRRAVILLQQDHFCIRKLLFKIENVPDVCLPESVNTLRIVADNTDVLLLFSEKCDQSELKRVSVLIFVNKDIFVPAVVFFPNLWRHSQQLYRLYQQVVKIQRIRFIQTLFVHLKNFCIGRAFFIGLLDPRCKKSDVLTSILCRAYRSTHNTRYYLLFIQSKIFYASLDDLLRVIRIVDRE